MSLFDLAQAAAAIGAEARGEATVERVCSDSRGVVPGDLFVALRGDKYDGHAFVVAAFEKGAAAALVERAAVPRHGWGDKPLLVVDDTRQALSRLAAWWRQTLATPLAAVTGSNGKTTVKEMLAAILRAHAGDAAVLATQGNLNNDVGVPLTLLALRPGHRYGVIEMGMNHAGEIAALSAIARPDVALVNNAQAAHLFGLGSVEAVARAKGEIFQGLGAQGVAVINADDPHAPLWRALAAPRRTLSFGLQNPADVRASVQLEALASELAVETPDGGFHARLAVPGLHNARNALAATAAALALGVAPPAIARGLAAFAGVKGRLQRKHAVHGGVLLDDTYNANPGSLAAALDVLAAQPGRRVLVLGDMGELGAEAAALHAEMGRAARAAGVERLIALGEASVHAARAFGTGGQHCETIEDLLHEAENVLAPGVTLLVKGSRFMRMERVIAGLEEKN
jgi:UDP-N-acetylmuramoyl-tripeptide--D-alanyl-D-alanine ligase